MYKTVQIIIILINNNLFVITHVYTKQYKLKHIVLINVQIVHMKYKHQENIAQLIVHQYMIININKKDNVFLYVLEIIHNQILTTHVV